MAMYYSELLRTVNNQSKKVTYFVKICDVFTRISLAEYDERYDSSHGICDLFNTTSKKFNRFYTTITIEVKI